MHQVEKIQSYFRFSAHKPHLEDVYVPLPYSEYIVIFNDENMQANSYDYFTDVVEYIRSADPNINVVQVTNVPDPRLVPNTHHVPALSHNQLYFLVKNSDGVISSDVFSPELCGIYNIPLVALAGNRFKGNARPYFYDEDLHTAFAPADQPSFMAVETDKVINKTPPEDIARSMLKKLNIKDPTPSFKTLFVGNAYRKYFVDYIPDFALEGNATGNFPITARLDLESNLDNVINASSHTNIESLTANKEFDIASLHEVRSKIKSIILEVNLDSSVEFIKDLNELGCLILLHTKDKENLNEIRFKFIDWIINLTESPDLTESHPEIDFKENKNLFYKSSKVTMSQGKKFSSLAARNLNVDDDKVIDNEEFRKELDHFLIYSLD